MYPIATPIKGAVQGVATTTAKTGIPTVPGTGVLVQDTGGIATIIPGTQVGRIGLDAFDLCPGGLALRTTHQN